MILSNELKRIIILNQILNGLYQRPYCFSLEGVMDTKSHRPNSDP